MNRGDEPAGSTSHHFERETDAGGAPPETTSVSGEVTEGQPGATPVCEEAAEVPPVAISVSEEATEAPDEDIVIGEDADSLGDVDAGEGSSTSGPNPSEAGSENTSHSFNIGNHLKNVNQLSDEMKYKLLQSPYIPPANFKFPTSKENGRNRSFNRQWLDQYDGLVYSKHLGGAFCKYCVLFGKSTGGALISKPFNHPLRKATEIFNAHFCYKGPCAKEFHVSAKVAAMEFFKVMDGNQPAVDVQINHALQERIAKNRRILSSIVKTVIFCGKQNLSLRGHRDDSRYLPDASFNTGNFQNLLEFRIDAGDRVLEEHFRSVSSRETMRSKTIQNEIIDVCGDFIRDSILAEIREAKFYSISADEVADQANHEQLSIVLRFVDGEKQIREEFLGFLRCDSTTGESLCDLILQSLQSWNLPLENCRGQTYDGAGNMAGRRQGVAARIQERNDLAIYTHCHSHKLNLAVVKGLDLPSVRNMMDAADQVTRFYNFSPKRQKNLEDTIDQAVQRDSKKSKLKEMCKTRWIQRHDALNVFVELLESVVTSLEDIMHNRNDWNPKTVTDATALQARITKFEFIIALQTTKEIMSYVQPLSVSLQARTMDIIKAMDHTKHVSQTLRQLREDVVDFHMGLYERACALAASINVDPAMPRVHGRQRHRANVPAENCVDYFRRNLTIPVLDGFIGAMDERFGQQQQNIIDGMVVIPAVMQERPRQEILNSFHHFCEVYQGDIPSPETADAELLVWITRWEHEADTPSTPASTLLVTDKDFFPNIYCILQILCTVGVTSCECERSISALRRLETFLRTTMAQDRLNGLALMHIHYSMELDIEAIIDRFARLHPRRMQFVNIFED